MTTEAAFTRSGFTSTWFCDFETASKSMRFGSVHTESFLPEASAALRAKFTILNRTMQISCQSNRIQIDAVSLFTREMRPYRFKNAPLLAEFSNPPGFANGLDWCRVNRIETGGVTSSKNDAVNTIRIHLVIM